MKIFANFIKKIKRKFSKKVVSFSEPEDNFFCNFTESHRQTFGDIKWFKECIFLDGGIILKEGPAVNPTSENDIGLYVVQGEAEDIQNIFDFPS